MKAAYPAAYNYISQKIGPNATPLAFDQAASDTMVALNGDSTFTKITSPNDVNSWGASAQYLNSAITGLGSTLGFNPNSGVIPASVFNTSPSSGASTSLASGYAVARPDLFQGDQTGIISSLKAFATEGLPPLGTRYNLHVLEPALVLQTSMWRKIARCLVGQV